MDASSRQSNAVAYLENKIFYIMHLIYFLLSASFENFQCWVEWAGTSMSREL